MSFKSIFVVVPVLSLLFPIAANAETERQHDAHEHGVSELKIAIDKNLLQIELESPGSDIVGFEHEAENDAQKAAIQAAIATLKDPTKLFDFPEAAGCSVTSSNAAFETEHEEAHEEHKDEHKHEEHKHEEHADEEEEGHAEFHVTYSLTCSSPQSLATIGLKFFDLFPEAKELELEAVSSKGQLAAEVMRGQKNIDLSSIAVPVTN